MMKCSKCKQNIVGNKKVKDKENKWDIARGAAFVLGGPIIQTTMAIGEGIRLYEKFVNDEVKVKCPHCKAELTLTKKEYKELKKEIKAVRKDERQSKQNRIER